VIVSMQKVRIVGPCSRIGSTIRILQDVGVVHLCPTDPQLPFEPVAATPRDVRHVALVERALGDVEEVLARLDSASPVVAPRPEVPVDSLAREVRLARRARRAVVALEGERRAHEDERERLLHLIEVMTVFSDMGVLAPRATTRTLLLVFSSPRDGAVERFRELLSRTIGATYAFYEAPIGAGEVATALVVPESDAARIEALLPAAGVSELELPEECASAHPADALTLLRHRLAASDEQLAGFTLRRKRLADWLLPGLHRARGSLNDWLLASEARATAVATGYLFVFEGWLPASERDALARALAEREGETIVIEDVARETWSARDVPVAIENPRIFRPFEAITRWLPLPRYGTMDPTPFVAVFFPMFFGLILGDLGYGAILLAVALLCRLRAREGGLLRPVAEITTACAVFSMIFGLVFGELFGDLGHRVLGIEPVAFSRADALVPFLVLALSLGFVHVVLGLVLGAISGFRHDRRESLSRGLSAVMLVLTGASLLAALNVLPGAFFTPLAVALILTFPVLIALEGVLGPIEFLSRLSNILSYARIMALGTASVMLAMVANRMVGTFGSVVVGVVFATLFHLVNFGLGVFSPTIHALRLHFVEFFGTFYSPGGLVYRPFRHWRPADAPTPQTATP
jgi:V/A-type H+-transporting ATPase subunit I